MRFTFLARKQEINDAALQFISVDDWFTKVFIENKENIYISVLQ
jgi:hypothetical protein